MIATGMVIFGLILILFFYSTRLKKISEADKKRKKEIQSLIDFHFKNAPDGKEFSHYERTFRSGFPWMGGGYYIDFTKPVYRDKYDVWNRKK